jgi:hypothetical protein
MDTEIYTHDLPFVFRTGFEGEGDGDGDKGGDKGGDGDGDKGGGDKTFTQADIDAAVDKSVSGLKSTNAALKDEKTAVKKQLDGMTAQFDALGGEEGIKTLAEFQKKLASDESTKLLADGKHEEWFDRRTAALRKDHENQLEALNEKLVVADDAVKKADGRLIKQVLKADVLSAAKDAGTVAEAASDIQLRAERAFKWDGEREALVLHDEEGGVLFGKDGKSPKGVSEWLTEQKESARHWWPPSKGAGADGSGDAGGDKGDEDISQLPYDEFAKKRAAQKLAREKERGFRPGA